MKMRSLVFGKTIFCVAALVYGSGTASANTFPESGNAGIPARKAALTVSDENDYWGKWSDKYYTNHTRIALTLDPGAHEGFYFYSIGQEIYTPRDREAKIPSANDHPYAGYLYASLGSAIHDSDMAIAMEIQLGATGEWSLAEQTQCEYHRWVDEMRPAGWDSQIHKRAVAQAIGDVRWRFMLDGDCANGDWASDLIVHGAGTLGNLRGIFSGGAQLRFGWNLPEDFGVMSLRHSASVTYAPKTDRSFYGFLGLQGDTVLWDKTLTGNNDRGADIYAYPLVAQFTIGLCAVYDRWMVSVYQTFRSKDFSAQDDDFFAYGGVQCSVFF